MEPNLKMTPNTRHEIRRRFFLANKNSFEKFFFTGSFSGSGPEIHSFVQTIDKYDLGQFKIQKKTQ